MLTALEGAAQLKNSGNAAFVLKHPSPPEFRMASQVCTLMYPCRISG
jgi:hypothetical protein